MTRAGAWLRLCAAATGWLSGSLASATPAVSSADLGKLAGCYDFRLTSGHVANEAVHRSRRRQVEFFAELTTVQRGDAAGDYALRENRSSGFGRLFTRAHWRVLDAQRIEVIFSDGAEQWTATMPAHAGRLADGSATYSGDAGHPDARWSATASRYTCRR